MQTKKQDALTITFNRCPGCNGFWLNAFNANYLNTDDITRTTKKSTTIQTTHPVCPVCPVCQEFLKPYTGENVPSNVRVWRCPNGDGYFFPEAELFSFKKAQQAKMEYYKSWTIPLPSIASVLLVAIIAFVSLGLVNTYLQYQSRQTTIIQARDLIRSQKAYVSGHTAEIVLTTTAKTQVTLHIGQFAQIMDSKDFLLHTTLLHSLPTGTYTYYFTITSGGSEIQSDMYTFTVGSQ